MRDEVELAARRSLLGTDDPPPYTYVNADGRAPVLLTCDHASRRVPAALDRLGLPETELARHIGWDIGAADVARALAPALDAPLLLAGYSRLVIDTNRAIGEATSIVEVVDGTVVPGNIDISAAERAERAAALHAPYHAAIAAALDRMCVASVVPVLVSVHSFTPSLKGIARPWHLGVLWNRDGRLAEPLLQRLRAEPGIAVGDNEPYSGRAGFGYTCATHAETRGIPNVLVEVRQDLIAHPAGVRHWSELLARALKDAIWAARRAPIA